MTLSRPSSRSVRASRIVDADTGIVSVGAGSRGSDALVEAVRSLDAAGVVTHGLALRRPSLDDVFLALTGHAAEEDGQPSGKRAAGAAAAGRQRHGESQEGPGLMTAIAAQTGPRESGPSPLTRTKWAVSDTLTIARRNLMVWMPGARLHRLHRRSSR